MEQRTDEAKAFLKQLIDHDLTQKDIARQMGVTPQAVQNRIRRGSMGALWEALEELQ